MLYVAMKREALGVGPMYPALAIFDCFKGQCVQSILSLLNENNIFYVIVPPNCTDRLQPMDLSINKPAKDFLKGKFQDWYAGIILQQLENPQAENVHHPVDVNYETSMWAIEMYNYFTSRPQIVINGFREAGIVDVLESATD